MRNLVVFIVLVFFASCNQTREEEYWDYNPSTDTSAVDNVYRGGEFETISSDQ